ncbi:hypothetical protein Q9Q99_16590 [Curtobacterium flaccumfaciens]|nr:hypothetical protein Q9Q99_16590 [Curtobacterium flaccumfaciens]
MPDTQAAATPATRNRPTTVPAVGRSGVLRRASPWVGAVIAVVIVVVAVAMLGPSSYDRLSRGYPGMLTSMLSAVLRLTADVTGGLTTGGLAAAVFLTPRRSRTVIDNHRDLAIVRTAATVWLVAAVLLVPVDAADASGQPVTKLLTPGAIGYLVQASYLPGAWIVVACIAVAILVAAYLVRSWVSTLLLTGIGVIGLLAPVLVTQVLVGPNHDFGGDAAMFAAPALGIWTGATAAGARRWRVSRPGTATIRRHRILALTGWITWTVGSIIIAAVELAGTPPWEAPTGVLFAAQLLLVAAVAGPILLRRSWFATPTAPAVLLAVLLVAAAIGVVMTRIPPPVYFVPTDGQQLFLGYQVDTPLTPDHPVDRRPGEHPLPRHRDRRDRHVRGRRHPTPEARRPLVERPNQRLDARLGIRHHHHLVRGRPVLVGVVRRAHGPAHELEHARPAAARPRRTHHPVPPRHDRAPSRCLRRPPRVARRGDPLEAAAGHVQPRVRPGGVRGLVLLHLPHPRSSTGRCGTTGRTRR